MAIRRARRGPGDLLGHFGGELEVEELPQDSLDISRNAKGEIQFCAKVYGVDAKDIDKRMEALLRVAAKHVKKARMLEQQAKKSPLAADQVQVQ